MLQLSIASLALVVAALSAQATATTAAPAATESGAVPAADKKICRREVATGTIMAKRVCKTQAEWSAQIEQSQEALRRMRRTGSGLGN